MKKVLFSFLVIILIVSSSLPIFNSQEVKAAELGIVTLGEEISDWVLDEEQNKIYAVTSSGNLEFISLANFSKEKTIPIGSNPVDVDLVGNQLYIALGTAKKVIKVDKLDPKITSEIALGNAPERIAVSDSKLFYASGDRVYAYTFANNLENVVVVPGKTYSPFSDPDLIVDKALNILYVAESGTTGANIHALSITDYSVVHESTYDDGYGFSLPNRNVIWYNHDIFYAGKRLDAGNLANIKGTYKDDSYPEKIVTVKGNHIFTKDNIFDRKTYTKLMDLPFETEFILAKSSDEVYLFNSMDKTIYKYNFVLNTTTSEYSHANNKLIIPYPLTDWVMDETTHKLYAISQTTNQLYVINTETLQLESQQFIGSMPSDIDLVSGILYVSNSGGTNITIQNVAEIGKTPPVDAEPVQYLTTKQNPYKITTDGSALFYATEDQHALLFHVDLGTSQEQRVGNLTTYYQPDVELDSVNKKLYVGESGSSGSNIYTLDSSTFAVIDKSTFNNGNGFSYPKREVILSGSDIFYAQQKFNKENLTSILASYPENVIFVDSKFVYTANAVYDRTVGTKAAAFPCPVNLAEKDSSGRVFVYSEKDHAVYRFNSVGEISAQSPTNVAKNISDENFSLSWNPVTADGYNVYFKTPVMTDFSKLNTSPIIDTKLDIPASQYKQWYDSTVTFKVTGLLCSMESAGAETSFTFEIPNPKNLQLTNSTDGKWTFTWDPVANMDGYKLFYKNYGETIFYPLNTSLITTNSFDVTDRANSDWQGKTLKFGVASRVNNKESIIEFSVIQEFPVVVNETPVGETTDTTAPGDSSTAETPTSGTTSGENTGGSGAESPGTGSSSGGSTGTQDNIGEISQDQDGDTTLDLDFDNFDEQYVVVKRTTVIPKVFYEFIQNQANTDYITVNLSKDFITGLNGEEGGKYLFVESESGAYQLPLSLEDFSGISENAKVEINIQKASEEYTDALQEITNDYGLQLVSKPIDFSIRIIDGDQVRTVDYFGSNYVERWLALPENLDSEQILVVVFNEETKTYQPVPTRVTVDEDGNYWAAFNRNGNSVYAVVQTTEKTFKDIQGNWAQKDIEFLASKLIVNGKSAEKFAPGEKVTRAEYTAFLSRALGLVPTKGFKENFRDVNDKNWFAASARAALESGMISGYDSTTFKPDETITREQMVAMTVRALEFVNGKKEVSKANRLSAFADRGQIGKWALDSAEKAVASGLIKGVNTQTFAPKQEVTRAESAAIIKRLIDRLYFNNYEDQGHYSKN